MSSASLEAFNLINLQELKEVIDNFKPSFCSSDIIHPRCLKLNIDSILPGLVLATVTPSILNKPLLDPSILKHFWPISVLPFI